MSEIYKYCTRCGSELSEGMQQYYQENHDSGPVLCLCCIRELFESVAKTFGEVVENGIEAMHKMFEEVFVGEINE